MQPTALIAAIRRLGALLACVVAMAAAASPPAQASAPNTAPIPGIAAGSSAHGAQCHCARCNHIKCCCGLGTDEAPSFKAGCILPDRNGRSAAADSPALRAGTFDAPRAATVESTLVSRWFERTPLRGTAPRPDIDPPR